MWFNVLKNEMRTINLPKFKIKPFENKPDTEDDDCRNRFIDFINSRKAVVTSFDKPDLLLHWTANFYLIPRMFEDEYRKFESSDRKTPNGKVTGTQESIIFSNWKIKDETLPDRTYSSILENIEKDTEPQFISASVMLQEYGSMDGIPEEVFCKALDLINTSEPSSTVHKVIVEGVTYAILYRKTETYKPSSSRMRSSVRMWLSKEGQSNIEYALVEERELKIHPNTRLFEIPTGINLTPIQIKLLKQLKEELNEIVDASEKYLDFKWN
jgi:hypothetical protein